MVGPQMEGGKRRWSTRRSEVQPTKTKQKGCRVANGYFTENSNKIDKQKSKLIRGF